MVDRFPKNVEGDFYTTGTKDSNGQWCGDCLACDLPESEAPDLMAQLTDDNYDTYFIRQPKSQEEIEQAIGATEVCCVNAVRYAGKDKKILSRLHPDVSDYLISNSGEVILNTETTGVVPSYKKWWQFWK